MENPLISIIVPIYMIERYVGACIESILKQTYDNLDIILVDDGSKDKCSSICDLYAKKDNRIQVVHKANGGLVSARKAGIRCSKGDYISYVDGDDWIEETFIESLYKEAEKSKADIVCAGFTRDLFNKQAKLLNALPSGVYSGEDIDFLWSNMISYDNFYRPGVFTYVWNKLFKKKVLLKAQESVDNRISIGEDGAVTFPALMESNIVSIIDNTDYHYRQREDSMLKQVTSYMQESEKVRHLYDYLLEWGKNADKKYRISEQLEDYILSIAIIRSGGRLPHDDYSTFNDAYYDKDVIIYSAGTFGQQLVNRFKETKHCNIVAWIDDDYWEYRRCGLNVDSVESISSLSYDYVLIATVDCNVAGAVKQRLIKLGVNNKKILSVSVPANKKELLMKFLYMT